MRHAPAPAFAGMAIALGLAGFPGATGAAPRRCDQTVTATPSTLPAGLHIARVRIPSSAPDIQLRASSGTLGQPVSVGTGAMVAELAVEPDSPPTVLVAAVGASFCGYSIVRVGSPPEGAPVGPVTLVLIEPATVPGDAESEVRVYVFAADDHGAPRRGKAPVLQPSAGSIAGVDAAGPGAWRAKWQLPAGKADQTRVEVAFGSEAPVVASLARTAGPPAAVEIEADPASTANGIPGAILVKVRDSAGNLTDGTPELSSDVATVGVPVRLERGVYRASLTLPTDTPVKSVVVVATANRIFATVTIAVASAPAAKVTVGEHEPILADGSSPGRLVVLPVTVTDASGNPVNDVPVGSAELGEFVEALFVGPGSWGLPYRPPRVLEDSVDHITVRAGSASTHADLQLLAARFSGSVGAKLGMVASGGVGPAFGLEGSAWASLGSSQLGLTLDLSWWTKSQTTTETIGAASSSYFARQNYLPILLSFTWRKLFGRRWLFWASGGGGLAVVWNHSQVEGQASVNEHGLAPAATLAVSTGYPLGPGAPFVELRLTWIGNAKLSTLSGSSVNFLLLFGYRFDVV